MGLEGRKVTTMAIPKDLYQGIKWFAKTRGITVNAMVTMALQEFMLPPYAKKDGDTRIQERKKQKEERKLGAA